MNYFYYKTFARICLLPYIGGTIIHILRLIYNFPIEKMPWLADWVVVLLGGYGGLGLIVFAHKIPFINVWDKIIYGLIIFHLNGSVLVHAYILFKGSHAVLSIFTYGYSFFAVAYFGALGFYVLRLNKRLYGINKKYQQCSILQNSESSASPHNSSHTKDSDNLLAMKSSATHWRG